MKANKFFYLISLVLVFFMIISTLNTNSYAEDNSQGELYLYGFGDNYKADDYLILYNTRTCYINIRNIPISEKENIELTIEDESIAEIQEITYGDSNPVITAKIKGKKLGTTDIIASLTYNGVNYTDKIITTVRESNYWIFLHREDWKDSEGTSMKKNESLKLVATLVQGMSWHRGDISTEAIWESNNESVVSVDNNGLVTAIEEGKATITAKYKTDEGVTITASFDVEVKDDSGSDPSAIVNQPTISNGATSSPQTQSSTSPQTQSDPTTAKTILPNAGGNITILIISAFIIMVISVIVYKKYKE